MSPAPKSAVDPVDEYTRMLFELRAAKKRGEDVTEAARELKAHMIKHGIGEGVGMPVDSNGDPL